MAFDDPITLALLGASSGFLDPRGGMSGGFQGALQGLMAGNEMKRQDLLAQQTQMKLARDMESRQLLADTIARQQQAGGKADPRSIGNALIATGHPELVKQGLDFIKAAPKARSSVKVMKDGQAFFQPMLDSGEYGEVGGLPAAEALSFQNLGNQTVGLNKFTGQPITTYAQGMTPGQAASLNQSAQQFNASHGLAQNRLALDQARAAMEFSPEFQGQKAASIAAGKEQAINKVKAVSDLPRVIDQGEQTIKLVDDLLNHPGFKLSVGGTAPIGKLSSLIPGTQEASFDVAFNQLKGKQFLEAFETLKGGGAITEIEGQKATQAMSRMEKANTEEEFTKAAHEFQGVIKQGINRAKMKAGGSPIQQQPSTNSDGYSVRRLD